MKINTALILCAGFGKRLNPITLETPKPLLKINNSTLLDRCIDLIIDLGIKKILINTFHLKEAFYEFLSIPNDGKNKDEIYKNIEWSKVQLESFDFNINLLKTSSLPLVLAEKIINKKLPTIAFYMHLDGQSVDLSKWDQKSPEWNPI